MAGNTHLNPQGGSGSFSIANLQKRPQQTAPNQSFGTGSLTGLGGLTPPSKRGPESYTSYAPSGQSPLGQGAFGGMPMVTPQVRPRDNSYAQRQTQQMPKFNYTEPRTDHRAGALASYMDHIQPGYTYANAAYNTRQNAMNLVGGLGLGPQGASGGAGGAGGSGLTPEQEADLERVRWLAEGAADRFGGAYASPQANALRGSIGSTLFGGNLPIDDDTVKTMLAANADAGASTVESQMEANRQMAAASGMQGGGGQAQADRMAQRQAAEQTRAGRQNIFIQQAIQNFAAMERARQALQQFQAQEAQAAGDYADKRLALADRYQVTGQDPLAQAIGAAFSGPGASAGGTKLSVSSRGSGMGPGVAYATTKDKDGNTVFKKEPDRPGLNSYVRDTPNEHGPNVPSRGTKTYGTMSNMQDYWDKFAGMMGLPFGTKASQAQQTAQPKQSTTYYGPPAPAPYYGPPAPDDYGNPMPGLYEDTIENNDIYGALNPMYRNPGPNDGGSYPQSSGYDELGPWSTGGAPLPPLRPDEGTYPIVDRASGYDELGPWATGGAPLPSSFPGWSPTPAGVTETRLPYAQGVDELGPWATGGAPLPPSDVYPNPYWSSPQAGKFDPFFNTPLADPYTPRF